MNNNNDFGRFFIGYDKVAEKLASIAEQSTKLLQNYPPFNIKKISENKYTIEVALAGFTKQDIDIELDGGKLIVKGNVESKESDDQFLFKGISDKAFTRHFTIADNMEIEGAELVNGMLKIWLETLAPETNKKKIPIKEPKTTGYKGGAPSNI
jgi:HSP20 family molecular chaperone IbpA